MPEILRELKWAKDSFEMSTFMQIAHFKKSSWTIQFDLEGVEKV